VYFAEWFLAVSGEAAVRVGSVGEPREVGF